jgi:hypothetical protein
VTPGSAVPHAGGFSKRTAWTADRRLEIVCHELPLSSLIQNLRTQASGEEFISSLFRTPKNGSEVSISGTFPGYSKGMQPVS